MAVLKATNRDDLGTRKSRRLRKAGKIPAIIYGHKKDAVAVTLEKHDIELVVLHGQRMIEIDLDGRTENVLLKDVQYDTFGQHVLHVDLTRVNLDERVQVTVPIVLRGTPAGAKEDGVLNQITSELSIECVVTSIPEDIRASVAELNVGDSLLVKDLSLPEGATVLDDPETTVCTVTIIAEEVEEVEVAEGAAEPEVIGEKPEEGEGEEEEEGKGKK